MSVARAGASEPPSAHIAWHGAGTNRTWCTVRPLASPDRGVSAPSRRRPQNHQPPSAPIRPHQTPSVLHVCAHLFGIWPSIFFEQCPPTRVGRGLGKVIAAHRGPEKRCTAPREMTASSRRRRWCHRHEAATNAVHTGGGVPHRSTSRLREGHQGAGVRAVRGEIPLATG